MKKQMSERAEQSWRVGVFALAQILILAGMMGRSSAAETARANSSGDILPTFWLIPHTHWEGAVFKTREEYLEIGLPNILTAVRLLKEHPHYRFTLDQVAYFKPFLQRYPEEAEAFRKYVAEGRLQIVCGLNVMPDDNMPSGESFVRQMLYAKGYCREALGVDVQVGWLLDTFGHHAQMPQVLKLAGFNSFWFFRGVEDRKTMPSEFQWQGLDGTRIPSFWLPFAYGHLYGPPKDLPRFSEFMQKRFDALAPFSRGGDRVGLAGVDVSEPELHVARLVELFNQQTNRSFTLRIGVPTDFEKATTGRPELPVVTGERNPLFQGIYSSRIELKQRMREAERALTTAEKLGALVDWLRLPSDEGLTWKAWEPALFNVTHDLASGVMTDGVYEDTLRGYDFSKRLADELIETRLDAVLSQIDTRGDGIPVAVFNTLGWTRTDVAHTDVGFAESGVTRVSVFDPSGNEIPAQIVEAETFRDGGLKRVKLAFVARDVPSIGHCVYHVRPGRGDVMVAAQPANTETNVIENEFYTLRFDLPTGALTNLLVKDKGGGWEALAGAANVVARERDRGDFWELYKNLDGFQNVIMTRPIPEPAASQALFSNEPITNRVNFSIRRGPVFSEYKLKRPFGNGMFGTVARVYAGVPRIDFETKLVNAEKSVRYRMLVPSSIRNGKRFDEIPFGAIERPLSQEFPAQNWIDCSDGRRGVAVLNRGLPGNNVAGGTLMVSLLRSTRIQSYGIGGGFEGQSSDSGFELGRELTFQYAIAPHPGDWRDGGATRRGLEFNNPFLVRKSPAHRGRLPARSGMFEISEPNVVLSALKPGKGGTTIVRFYEAHGKATRDVSVKLPAAVLAVHEANLMEVQGAKIKVSGDTFHLSFHPFEIKTCELKLR